MPGWARLEVSDGETTVSLIAASTGFHLSDWRPQIIQPKDGGVFQDSPIAEGRRLVYAVDATAIETFDLDVNDTSQDGLIAQAQNLMRLLLKARAYQSTDFQGDPVWIRARAECETEDRFALIINWSIPDLDNPYASPFLSATELVAMEDISLQIERGQWLNLQPGTSECCEISTAVNWNYQAAWALTALAGSDTAYSLMQAANGSIYAGGTGQIFRSTDNGATWPVNTILPTDIVLALFQAANGYIYAGENGQILRSVDNGANWTINTTLPVNDVAAFTEIGGYILAGDEGKIWRSSDNGASWASVTLPIGNESVRGFTIKGTVVYLIGDFYFEKSTDNGATWTVVSQITTQTGLGLYSLTQAPNGDFYIGVLATTAQLFKSTDNGLTWALVKVFNGNGVYSILANPDGSFFLGDQGASGAIWYSPDGYYWVISQSTTTVTYALIRSAEPAIFAGGANGIYKLDLSSATMGTAAICGEVAFVGNRQNVANLTHIKIDDGGVFTDIFPMSSFPTALYPASIVANDALYFGIQTTITDSGPFAGLVFDIATIIPPTISRTILWEYWSGAAWTAFTVIMDNTDIGAGSFGQSGVTSVHWRQPSNWATTAVNGVTGYWVRARVSAKGGGTVTPPTQRNRQIYAINSAFVETSDITGDIPAIVRIKAHNTADFNTGFVALPLWENRVVVGGRSVDRGEGFQAYINISDEQNPPGVVVTLGANTTFVTDITAATGRNATYNPGGTEVVVTRALITFGPEIARDFYGVFHAYVTAYQTAGSIGDISVRLQVATGSGGIIFTTPFKTCQGPGSNLTFELLDFDAISLPVSDSFSDLADATTISIQAKATSGTPDLRLYNLILIPTDEWACDATDQVLSLTAGSISAVGRVGGIQRLIDIDSTNPRNPLTTLVRQAPLGLVVAEYNPVANGPAVLQSNRTQRLWFLALQWQGWWLAPPEIAHSIQVFKNERYLGLIGESG